MGEVYTYGSEVANTFQISATLEDDIIKSINWALSNSSEFIKKTIYEVVNIDIFPRKARINDDADDKSNWILILSFTFFCSKGCVEYIAQNCSGCLLLFENKQ